MKKPPVPLLLLVLCVIVVGVGLWDGWFGPTWPSNRSLARALRGVDRVRVRTGGTCHDDAAQERTLAEETDPAAIEALVSGLRINAARSGHHCMCCGDPTLEFYRGEKLVVTLGCHHGKGIRWPGGWVGDGRLTPEGSAALKGWLASRGVKPRE